MNGLALCAGCGGLELGIKLALGEQYRTVCFVERQAYNAAALVARMADKTLDEVPVWDDLLTFAGHPWRGVVDIISAGLPCQPYSIAGRHWGHGDARAIWPDFIRVVGEVRPSLVFLENVPAFVTGGFFREPGEELCLLGYQLEDPLFIRAADVGAPHKRERVFIMAHARRAANERQRSPGEISSAPVRKQKETRPEKGDTPGNSDDAVGHLSSWPPGPTDQDAWGRIALSHPYLLPTVMATKSRGKCSNRETESALRRVADGLAPRMERLHAIGNGVVPLVAALALSLLLRRAKIGT